MNTLESAIGNRLIIQNAISYCKDENAWRALKTIDGVIKKDEMYIILQKKIKSFKVKK